MPPLQLIQNFKLRTLIKKFQSLNSVLTVNKCFLQLLLFGFTFLDLLIKFMKMRLLYILYCPPSLQRDGKDTFIPSPFYIDWFAAPPSPPILPSYWPAQRPTTSHIFGRRERGGDWYYITTSRMAEGSKDPCISHIDASHGEWPRIESSLLFCIFFYIVKIIEKSLFYEPEIGFIGKITC